MIVIGKRAGDANFRLGPTDVQKDVLIRTGLQVPAWRLPSRGLYSVRPPPNNNPSLLLKSPNDSVKKYGLNMLGTRKSKSNPLPHDTTRG